MFFVNLGPRGVSVLVTRVFNCVSQSVFFKKAFDSDQLSPEDRHHGLQTRVTGRVHSQFPTCTM